MAWLKSSDRSAMHPLVLRIRRVRRADDRSVNEVYGFVARCSVMSAAYMTDYAVDLEVAEQCGLGRTPTLLAQAVEAGLMRTAGRGRARRWIIVEDEDLFHIRAREDIEWERQRDRDTRDSSRRPDPAGPSARDVGRRDRAGGAHRVGGDGGHRAAGVGLPRLGRHHARRVTGDRIHGVRAANVARQSGRLLFDYSLVRRACCPPPFGPPAAFGRAAARLVARQEKMTRAGRRPVRSDLALLLA